MDKITFISLMKYVTTLILWQHIVSCKYKKQYASLSLKVLSNHVLPSSQCGCLALTNQHGLYHILVLIFICSRLFFDCIILYIKLLKKLGSLKNTTIIETLHPSTITLSPHFHKNLRYRLINITTFSKNRLTCNYTIEYK